MYIFRYGKSANIDLIVRHSFALFCGSCRSFEFLGNDLNKLHDNTVLHNMGGVKCQPFLNVNH